MEEKNFMQPPSAYARSAVDWALTQIGSSQYVGLCYAFCEDAYELGGNILLDGKGTTAKEAAEYYLAMENDSSTAHPSIGSYVFFDCTGTLMGEYKNWGHMGLSLGDGRMIHSWDGVVRLDEIQAIRKLPRIPGWTVPEYIGWCSPEVILIRMREN